MKLQAAIIPVIAEFPPPGCVMLRFTVSKIEFWISPQSFLPLQPSQSVVTPLSLRPHFQSINKSYYLYLQNISEVDQLSPSCLTWIIAASPCFYPKSSPESVLNRVPELCF